MRAVSTALDVSLCLLFVTASALTLAGTPLADRSNPATAPDTADETVEVLTTTTASVTYAIGDRNRTAHDTLAGLLASAALGDADSASAVEFRRIVTQRVGRTLRFSNVSVQVVADVTADTDTPSKVGPGAQSKPDRDSTLGQPAAGPLVVGTQPPPNVDVHAATVRIRGVRLTVRTWSR